MRYKLNAVNLAGTEATRAHMKSLVSSVYVCLNCSDVGFPLSVGLAVRVRNFESERYTFSADITLCHILHLQFYIQIIIILCYF